jgi:hypothetical protein
LPNGLRQGGNDGFGRCQRVGITAHWRRIAYYQPD